MDFSQLRTTTKKTAPVDPIKLFESLPSLESTPNDLWRGQAEALKKWNLVRDSSDVLVSLNTGAGKTIVGLLIAQSLVNEGVENVIYVCSTIDLVKQTATEARRIGMPYTTRVKRGFGNDLFETGKSFCITTYQALFNGHSTLRRKFFPRAVIFDDAHVAEGILRDAFTVRINCNDYPELFNEICLLFIPHFKELNILGKFKDSVNLGEQTTAFVAPRGLQQRKSQLLKLFEKHNIKDDKNLTYAFSHIKDHIEACSAIFTRGVFELSPPFLPSLALDIFERPIKRIYLSATLQSQTEFIRAFGRKPSKTVVPSNDAGNGERLIINGQKVKGGFSPEYIKEFSQDKKIIIAVPSYSASEKWEEISKPPTTEKFSESLNDFRKADKGAFTLVSRVDGIDLPHDTCRLMLMECLPSGTSLIERYQWEFLKMNNVHATRIANRLAQLFGRINRGRNDYGVFLIAGKELNIWLANDRNVSLLPPLLQKQVMLGRSVQEGMLLFSTSKVSDAISSVLNRDETWLNHYESEVKLGELDKRQMERARIAEPVMEEAALIESKYAAFIWNGDYGKARQVMEKSIDKFASTDTPLGGWHGVWLGAAFDLEGDSDSADRAYDIAKTRIGPAITLPRLNKHKEKNMNNQSNHFALSLLKYIGFSNGGKSHSEIQKLKEDLSYINKGTANQAEEAVRKLGEIIGFRSTRPDNDQGTGPDVLWIDDKNRFTIGFELKTDKKSPAKYQKKDIGQGHDHLIWINEQHVKYNQLGLLYVGPDGYVSDVANPSSKMGLCTIKEMVNLRERVLALIDDFMSAPPNLRHDAIEKQITLKEWNLDSLFKQLWVKGMSAMNTRS